MRELHVVALSEDGRHVVLAGTKSATKGGFRVALDARLLAAVRGELPRPGESAPPPVTLTPREIQDRLRAGESEEQIARSAGVPVSRVERFSGPVLSERVKIVESARAAVLVRGRRGPSAVPLGRAVDRHLAAMQGLKADSVSWSARRIADGRWVVEVAYFSRGHSRVASWLYDPSARTVAATDPASAGLGHIDPADDKTVPDFDDEIPTAVRLRVSAPRPAAGGRVAPPPPSATAGPVVGAGKKAVASGSTTRAALKAAGRAAGRSDARVAGAPEAREAPRAAAPVGRRVTARVGAAAARPGALPPRIGAGPSAVETAGGGATAAGTPAKGVAAKGAEGKGAAPKGAAASRPTTPSKAAGAAGAAAAAATPAKRTVTAPPGAAATRAAKAGPAKGTPTAPTADVAKVGPQVAEGLRPRRPSVGAGGTVRPRPAADVVPPPAAATAGPAAPSADVPDEALLSTASLADAASATTGAGARPATAPESTDLTVTRDASAGRESAADASTSAGPADLPEPVGGPAEPGAATAPVAAAEPAASPQLPPPAPATDAAVDPASETSVPGPAAAETPDPEPGPAAAETADPEPDPRPAGSPPALRVVPPPAADATEPQRPARKSARGRASVPAWADVLLSTAPRHEDDPAD